ncbi:hypothetical protein DTO013E5_9324 [Penicillium roqueforti]|uniref:Uncharacterized protein n=1 Tax=Penicillium roqueforti (strain FM164) TaxID=1365484 RepID=W6QKX3_PENRF|nr:uncharacterized protein LCP9604111_9102 [Penicillium roqueforti]CDM37100.1 unnamed protein product [Penicillium roqueforti FM164]KAF9239560.1 hypothetical protein LCP9604111_9102 [Penicillium roqueforti]KAI1829671.1 hypothetical protein CBS147337_9559 [Penicillium roqueforti]KAI2669960.1 hypothetical protein CBS147355_9548 [Penicillium roqueforti]KAI2671900.1 hypothetical protein LCP963914a_9531 [Penicillium roqueforti]
MRSPEMSYSPAYYHDQGPNPRSSIVTPPPATRHSQEQSSVLGHPVGESRTSSPIPSRDASPRTSGSRQHRVYHTQTLGGTAWPGSDARDGGSTLSGAHKEERATSSWADQPSVMSGELSNPSITRVRKRPISNVEIITNEGQDALLMLFRLTIIPFYSLGATLYTIFALLFALFVSPFRLCSFSPYLCATTFASQLCDLLSPILHIHERLVCLQPPSVEDRSSSTQSTQWIRSEPDSDQPSVLSEPSEVYAVTSSIFVLLLSPLLSIVILLFAWTAAFFWVFSMVLGNPDGTERKDDGRTAVLGVCKWWRSWLCRARKS